MNPTNPAATSKKSRSMTAKTRSFILKI